MECKHVMDYLPSFIGKEIPWWKQLLVQRHLQSCKKCQLELIKLKKARDLSVQFLNRKQTTIADNTLWEDILPVLPEEKSKKTQLIKKPNQRRSPILKWIPAIAGIPIIILIVIINNLYKEPQQQKQQENNSINYPVIEGVNKPGVTVMTFQTSDPKITIVWFFEEESNDERKEGLL